MPDDHWPDWPMTFCVWRRHCFWVSVMPIFLCPAVSDCFTIYVTGYPLPICWWTLYHLKLWGVTFLLQYAYLHCARRGELRKLTLMSRKIPRKMGYRGSRSKSSNQMFIGTKRTCIYDFLLVINSNFGYISHASRVTATQRSKMALRTHRVSFKAIARGDHL